MVYKGCYVYLMGYISSRVIKMNSYNKKRKKMNSCVLGVLDGYISSNKMKKKKKLMVYKGSGKAAHDYLTVGFLGEGPKKKKQNWRKNCGQV